MVQERPSAGEIRVAAYRVAIAGWVFMAVWLTFLGIFTWLFIREGGFHQFAPPVEVGIMMLFWLFGAAGAGYLFGMPIVILALDGGGFIAREYWLLRVRESRFAVTGASRPAIRKTKDSEGDDYFLLEATTPEGRRIPVGGCGDGESAGIMLSAMDQIIDRR